MIKEVRFLSHSLAVLMAPYGREGIISITSPGRGQAKLRRGWRRVLRLQFNDIEKASPGRVLFHEDHAVAILGWLEKVEDHLDAIYVHCQAGKHRSAAVAKFIAERYNLSGFNRMYPFENKRVYRVLWRQWRKRRSGSK